MSTLHEHLLARIDRGDPYRIITVWKVVRAVVELHAPIQHKTFGTLCGECSQLESGQGMDGVLLFVAEPCNTKRAIATELGVDGG